MDALQRLTALEDIRQLKARYWRGVDTKNAHMLRGVFADDAQIDMRGAQLDPETTAVPLYSPGEFVAFALGSLEDVRSLHHGHLPDIEFASEIEATGFWPMEDNLWVDGARSDLPFRHLQGFGFYHERYRKTEQGWRISHLRLERVHVNMS
jgi:hypothetical protein